MKHAAQYCAACGGANPAVVRCCIQCGADLDGDGRPGSVACPECRALGMEDAAFCTRCGSALDGSLVGPGPLPADLDRRLERLPRRVLQVDPREPEELAREVREGSDLDPTVERSPEGRFRVVLREKRTRSGTLRLAGSFAAAALFGALCTFFAVKATPAITELFGVPGLSRAVVWVALVALWLVVAVGWGALCWYAAARLVGRREVVVGPDGVVVSQVPIPWFGFRVPIARIAELRLSAVEVGDDMPGTSTMFDLELVPVSGRIRPLVPRQEREPLVLAQLLTKCLGGHSWKGQLVVRV